MFFFGCVGTAFSLEEVLEEAVLWERELRREPIC